MPRRLILGILIVLILGIVGGTIALIVQRLRTPTGSAPTASPGALSPAEVGPQQVENPTADDDGDGLTNAEEVVWGSSATNPDTDGDGYKDGEEVAANHNPTIPAPNDKLPADFAPGQNLQALPEAPLQADRYFADNLNLQPTSKNLTQEFNQQYSEAERTQETMVAFAKQQPIITSLPTVKAEVIKPTENDSALALGHYLDTAGNFDALIDRTVIAEIFNDLFNDNDPSTAYGQVAAMRIHQQSLIELPVPPAAVELQRLLLGYTELLAATYSQLGAWNEDPVKAMVGINQLDTIDRKYTPLIRSELERLEKIKASAPAS